MKIGDLSIQQGGVPLSDAQAEEMMDINGHDHSQIPSGTDVGETVILSREEERTLARDSTAGFAGELFCPEIFRQAFLTLCRLGRFPFQTNPSSVRKPSRRRRQKEHHRW